MGSVSGCASLGRDGLVELGLAKGGFFPARVAKSSNFSHRKMLHRLVKQGVREPFQMARTPVFLFDKNSFCMPAD
jgi:hypothetical protein